MRVNVRFTIASTAVASTIALSLISSGAAHATPAPRTAAVQYQSYQRASQDAACDNPPPLFAPWQSDWADATNPVSGPHGTKHGSNGQTAIPGDGHVREPSLGRTRTSRLRDRTDRSVGSSSSDERRSAALMWA